MISDEERTHLRAIAVELGTEVPEGINALAWPIPILEALKQKVIEQDKRIEELERRLDGR